jgi:hypothetical protein
MKMLKIIFIFSLVIVITLQYRKFKPHPNDSNEEGVIENCSRYSDCDKKKLVQHPVVCKGPTKNEKGKCYWEDNEGYHHSHFEKVEKDLRVLEVENLQEEFTLKKKDDFTKRFLWPACCPHEACKAIDGQQQLYACGGETYNYNSGNCGQDFCPGTEFTCALIEFEDENNWQCSCQGLCE